MTLLSKTLKIPQYTLNIITPTGTYLLGVGLKTKVILLKCSFIICLILLLK
jgi:hypothetical protein